MVSLRVDLEIDCGAAHACAAHAEENIVERDGIVGMAGVAAVRADLQQDGREGGAGVKEQAGEDDAVHVGGGHGGGAVDGPQRGEAEAHDDGVGARDAEGFGQVVDAGREEQMFAGVELRVDGGGGVRARVGDDRTSRWGWIFPALSRRAR